MTFNRECSTLVVSDKTTNQAWGEGDMKPGWVDMVNTCLKKSCAEGNFC